MDIQKPHNGGEWSSARYRSFIVSALRGAFRRWQPKYTCLNNAFTTQKINKASGRLAKHYRCAKCRKDYPQKQVQVDHIVPIGSFASFDDFIKALFCEIDNLQVLCKPCHAKKTKKERTSKNES